MASTLPGSNEFNRVAKLLLAVNRPFAMLSRTSGASRYVGQRVGELPAYRRGLASMARVSLADRGRLSWLALRRGLDHAAARVLSHPLLQRPGWLGKPDRVVIAPQDLRTADPTRAAEIYGGRF